MASNNIVQLNTISISRMMRAVPTGMATNLVLGLRDLWLDHIVYTRNYIISFVAGLPDTNVVAQRLLKNQEDIGNAIKPFYGEPAGTKLTGLLKGHIQ
ncbi:MAG: hypothetical protein WAZ77_01700 [Candidatus Nitrosopolaris sp.]|jgi:hypothetical protein